MWLIFHMGGCVEETFQGFSSMVDAVFLDHETMVRDDDGCDSVSFSDGSSGSIVSTSSWDFSDDATSSSTLNNLSTPASTSPEVYSNGPLFELSELMAHLPIKRGLSKHYQGKSQSYTSLSNVRCIEDLAKKETTYSKKMKSCKSYGGFLDCQKSYTLKACTRTISKKATKSTLLLLQSKKSSFICTRPPIPIQKTLNW